MVGLVRRISRYLEQQSTDSRLTKRVWWSLVSILGLEGTVEQQRLRTGSLLGLHDADLLMLTRRKVSALPGRRD